ncbi:MAG: DivIVA domain-containing protein [Acidimicrobiia bacterium]
MISASIARTHRFGRVKRNGYDPAEVDAVVGRLVDAVTDAEERSRDLETKLDDAQVSATAIARTLAAVEKTRDSILADTEADAQRIIGEARLEAETVAVIASNLGAEISARRDAILTEAYQEADAVVARAEATAAARESESAASAATTIADAVAESDAVRREAATEVRNITTGAVWASHKAAIASQQRLDEARAAAAAIIEDARHESDRLRERIASLRTAVATLQASATSLAREAVAGAEVIDLNAIEAMDRGPDEPAPIRPAEPTVKVAAKPAETKTDDRTDDGVATYYQRRAGSIRERIEIARLVN